MLRRKITLSWYQKSQVLTVVKMRVCFALNKCFEISSKNLLYKSLPDILLYWVFGNDFGKRRTIKIDSFLHTGNYQFYYSCSLHHSDDSIKRFRLACQRFWLQDFLNSWVFPRYTCKIFIQFENKINFALEMLNCLGAWLGAVKEPISRKT